METHVEEYFEGKRKLAEGRGHFTQESGACSEIKCFWVMNNYFHWTAQTKQWRKHLAFSPRSAGLNFVFMRDLNNWVHYFMASSLLYIFYSVSIFGWGTHRRWCSRAILALNSRITRSCLNGPYQMLNIKSGLFIFMAKILPAVQLFASVPCNSI